MWKHLQRVGKIVVDTVEVYVPFATFVMLFVVFLLGIFFRYFLRPLTWTLELSLICFIWTALLGGIYAKRKNGHVMFTMVYDSCSSLVQTWMRIVGNGLLIFAFLVGFYPSLKYVLFMSFKKSNVLKIPTDISYFPFVVFLAFMIVRYSIDLVGDIRKLLRKDLAS